MLAANPDPQEATQKPDLTKNPELQVWQLVALLQILQFEGQAKHSLTEFANLPAEHFETHLPFSRNRLEAHFIHLAESHVIQPASHCKHFILKAKKPVLQAV
jgi:hypothetical protein